MYPVALVVLEGQEAHGDPGDTLERTAWVAGGGQEVLPIYPCSKGWTCPCLTSTHWQDKGTREHEDQDIALSRELPLLCPPP